MGLADEIFLNFELFDHLADIVLQFLDLVAPLQTLIALLRRPSLAETLAQLQVLLLQQQHCLLQLRQLFAQTAVLGLQGQPLLPRPHRRLSSAGHLRLHALQGLPELVGSGGFLLGVLLGEAELVA